MSAVSPDCEIARTAVPREKGSCRYLNSEANCTSTGIKVINSSRTSSIGGGGSSSLQNLFEEIKIGVDIVNSNVEIKNSRFVSCKQGIVYNSSGKNDLTVTGFGNLVTSPAVFNSNEEKDINIKGSVNFKCQNVSSVRNSNSAFGIENSLFFSIFIIDSPNSNFNISDNRFTVIRVGSSVQDFRSVIHIKNALNFSISYIKNCVFFLSDCPNFRSIDLNNVVNPNRDFFIKENEVLAWNNKFGGMSASNSERIRFDNNNLYRSNTFTPAIQIIESTNCRADNNTIDETTDLSISNRTHSGVYVLGGMLNTLCQNKLIKCEFGITVEGESDAIQVSENKFSDVQFGLLYNNGTITNITNSHRMNYWTELPSAWEAYHHGGTFKLNVYETRMDNYSLPQKYDPTIKFPAGNDWINSMQTGSPNGCELTAMPPQGNPRFLPWLDPTNRNGLSEGQLFDGWRSFWSESNTTMTNALYSYYRDSLMTTSIPQFVQVENNLKTAIIFTQAEENQLLTKFNLVNLIQTQITNVENILASFSEINEDDPLLGQLDSLYNQFELVWNDYDMTLTSAKTRIDQDLLIIQNSISLIPSQNNTQSVEKYLLSTLINQYLGIENTAAIDQQLLQYANRCITEYGDQVLLAQSLLSDSLQYQRFSGMFCNGSSIQQAMSQNLENSFAKATLFNDQIQIVSDNVLSQFEVYDINGRLVSSGLCSNSILLLDKNKLTHFVNIIKLIDHKGNIQVIKVLVP